MSLRDLLQGVPIPIVQAPMVGAQDERMTIAVCQAGAMGSLGAGGLAPADIEAAAAAIRAATDAPFNVNLQMAPALKPSAEALGAAMTRLERWYARFGEPLPPTPNTFAHEFEAQLEALVRVAPPIASFIFGVLDRADVERLKAAGSYVVGTANTVAEARAWAGAGADGICAQGFEAGGHHGYFLGDIEASSVGTMALVATIAAAVEIPVIAAGGIMDGRGIAAALMLGAAGVQMGTAFLSSPESGISAAWREALRGAKDDSTRVSRIYSGRYARGMVNEFMRKLTPVVNEIPPYPIQNALTQPIRQAAAKAGRGEYLSLWAGQAASMARGIPAAELFAALVRETYDALGRAASASSPRASSAR